EIPPYPSIHIGSAEVIPAELVGAYAAFANGGYRVKPHLITRVEDAHGNVLSQTPFDRRRALDENVAFRTLRMMEDVLERGTGTAVRNAGFWLPAAGKTGTTSQRKDAWFVGMTPDLVAGVWIGFDRPKRILPNGSGGSLAAPAWAELMRSEEHTSELQSRENLVCRLLLEKKKHSTGIRAAVDGKRGG